MARRSAGWGTWAAFAALAAAACGPPPAPLPEIVRVGLGTRPISFDPHATTELVALSVNSNLYDGLVRLDSDLRPRPRLAASWYSIDDLSWTFELVDGARFHDGRLLEAQDVAYSLLRARDDPGSEWAASLATISSVETPSPRRVLIHTRAPDTSLVTGLASVMIVPADAGPIATSRLAREPDGTGPYRLRSLDADGARVDLEATDAHWRDRPDVRRLVFASLPDEAERAAALGNGSLDLVVGLPVELRAPGPAAGFRIEERPGLLEIFLGFDHARARTPYAKAAANPFRDRRVRQAVALALDRRELVEGELGGAGLVAHQLVAPGVFGWDPALRAEAFDPERARRLLGEAGYPEGFAVVLDVPDDSFVGDARVGPWVVRSLATIGVRVELRRSPKPELFRRWAERDTSFFVGGWTCTTGDQQEVLDFVLHTPDPVRGYGGENAGAYSNPALDHLADVARGSPRHDTRLGALREAARLALEDVAWVPLYLPNDRYGVRLGLRWTPRPDQLILGAEMSWRAAPPREARAGR